ncbi:hypothetical protein B0O40_1047 [Ruminococcaceae bacterium R-25]|nr:hypothetical protein B0O40_1047 [Ruminococcaceae bacterium R-25]SUQ11661.1 hypothetical protein SAMN06297423_1047 [Oscillospiraceae bacterium]
MKMETPKMDVVRFQEADVIVASGDHNKMATLFGWGDTIQGNAKLTFSNGKTSEYDWESLQNQKDDEMLGNLSFKNQAGSTATLNQLASDENSYGAWNGLYERTSAGHYEWYVNQ